MRQFLKYEFKNNWKQFLTSYILIIASFLVLSIFILIVKDAKEPTMFMTILYANFMLLIGGAMIASAALFVSNFIKSMYNSIFTDEGYLTLSFPKSTDSLIISKIIANIIWAALYSIATCIGFTIMYLSLMILFGEPINIMFEELYQLLLSLELDLPWGVIPLVLLQGFVDMILGYVLLLLSFAIINTGITKKGKVGLGILLFFGLMFALRMVTTFTSFISFGFAYDVNGQLVFAGGGAITDGFIASEIVAYVFNFMKFFISCGCMVGGYFLTKKIIQNHLELE